MQCAGNPYPRHRIHDKIRLIDQIDGYAETLTGFACGETGDATGDLGFRVKDQHTSAAMCERCETGVMQAPSDGDHRDLGVLSGKLRSGEQAVAAVIAGSGEYDHIGVLERYALGAEHAFGLMRGGCRSHTHQWDAVIQQRPLQFTYRVRGICVESKHLQAFMIDALTHGMAPFLSLASRPAAHGIRTALPTVVPFRVNHAPPVPLFAAAYSKKKTRLKVFVSPRAVQWWG